jgi:hypothetical protein
MSSDTDEDTSVVSMLPPASAEDVEAILAACADALVDDAVPVLVGALGLVPQPLAGISAG